MNDQERISPAGLAGMTYGFQNESKVVPAQGAALEPAKMDDHLDVRAANILQKCKSFVISCRDDFSLADKIVSEGAALIKGIKLLHDPLCAATNKAHKLATKTRKDLIDPVDAGTRHLTSLMSNYKLAEDRRVAEERRIEQEKAQKEQEEAALKQAAELEKKGAPEEVVDAVMALAEEPVIVESTKQDELKSKTSFQIDWEISITDKAAVPETFKVVDEGAILKVIRAAKGEMKIPGIQVRQTQKARRNAAR